MYSGIVLLNINIEFKNNFYLYFIQDGYKKYYYNHNKNRLVCSLNSASNFPSIVKCVLSINHCRALVLSSIHDDCPSTTSDINCDCSLNAFIIESIIESNDGPFVTSICK
jgi:hypothetical protein